MPADGAPALLIIDGGARFWYAVSNGAGKRFLLVDPAARTREPAFDHARLAAMIQPRRFAMRPAGCITSRRCMWATKRALPLSAQSIPFSPDSRWLAGSRSISDSHQ